MSKSLLRQLVPCLHPVRWAIINGICLLWSLDLLVLILVYPDDPLSQDFVQEHYDVYDLFTCFVWVVEVIMDVIYFLGFLGLRDGVVFGADNSSSFHSEPQQYQSSQPPQQHLPQSHDQVAHPLQELYADEEQNQLPHDSTCCHGMNSVVSSEECRTHSLYLELILAVYFLIDSAYRSSMELREIDREDENLTLDVMINAAAYLYITIRQYKEWKNERRRLMGTVDTAQFLDVSSS